MGKIFISYRRDDSDKTCDAIYQRLAARFGASNVFRDTYAIPYGVDFRHYIAHELETCAVQLVVIGRHWVTVSNEGQRRLDDPNDIVRTEVETALRRGIPVYPVMVDQAGVPSPSQLPESLQQISFQNAVILERAPGSDPKFGRLMNEIARKLPRGQQAPGWEQIITSRMDGLDFIYNRFAGVGLVVPPVVQVPAGAFMMGSNASEQELPICDVAIQEFSLAIYPVTAAEYGCYVRAGHAPPPDRGTYWTDQLGHPDHPVVNVSWHDAMAYAAWLSSVTGQSWRLPTEAEWEKAARWNAEKGAAFEYPWGNAFDASRCNTEDSGKHTVTPVGTYGGKGASPHGVQDMSGNVWEWTSTLRGPYPYAINDGRELADAPGERIRRGGSWNSVAANARGAKRAWDEPMRLDGAIGFRLALGVAQTN